MSVMWPSRSSRQTTSTRMPVSMASAESTNTACNIGVSAPSRVIIAQANGWLNGCWGRGTPFQVHVVTVPTVLTGTSSVNDSDVIGSYSSGGHITVPSDRRTPWITPSRRPVRNPPITGPVVRVKGYSSTSGAVSTSSAIVPPGQANAARRSSGDGSGRATGGRKRPKPPAPWVVAGMAPPGQLDRRVSRSWTRSADRSVSCRTRDTRRRSCSGHASERSHAVSELTHPSQVLVHRVGWSREPPHASRIGG